MELQVAQEEQAVAEMALAHQVLELLEQLIEVVEVEVVDTLQYHLIQVQVVLVSLSSHTLAHNYLQAEL
jgi:hypothetical protein